MAESLPPGGAVPDAGEVAAAGWNVAVNLAVSAGLWLAGAPYLRR